MTCEASLERKAVKSMCGSQPPRHGALLLHLEEWALAIQLELCLMVASVHCDPNPKQDRRKAPLLVTEIFMDQRVKCVSHGRHADVTEKKQLIKILLRDLL